MSSIIVFECFHEEHDLCSNPEICGCTCHPQARERMRVRLLFACQHDVCKGCLCACHTKSSSQTGAKDDTSRTRKDTSEHQSAENAEGTGPRLREAQTEKPEEKGKEEGERRRLDEGGAEGSNGRVQGRDEGEKAKVLIYVCLSCDRIYALEEIVYHAHLMKEHEVYRFDKILLSEMLGNALRADQELRFKTRVKGS